MPTVYRVSYLESESVWGQDRWNTDYPTEAEARQSEKETNEKFCSSPNTPSYYIRAEYIGPINL